MIFVKTVQKINRRVQKLKLKYITLDELYDRPVTVTDRSVIHLTNKEVKCLLTVTADHYNKRTVSYDRFENFKTIMNKVPYMSFKRLCELSLTSIDTIKVKGCKTPVDIREYLLLNFNRDDEYKRIVRRLC